MKTGKSKARTDQLAIDPDLVHDEGRAILEVGDALVSEVEHTPGRADQDVHHVVQTHDVVLQGRAPGCNLNVPSKAHKHKRTGGISNNCQKKWHVVVTVCSIFTSADIEHKLHFC